MTEEEKVIFELQTYLRNIAQGYGDISNVYPDGKYAAETRRAVTDFQRSRGIRETGEVDSETWEKLVLENEKALLLFDEPLQIIAIENADLPLSKGDRNEFVRTLKIMLSYVSSLHKNFLPLAADDFFDSETEDRVRLWQSVAFLPETGVADKLTWNSLGSFYLLKSE